VTSLPGVGAVAEALINHAFEVEEMVEKDGDMEMDIKILPDRASDAKSVLGVAREVSAVMNLPLKDEYKFTTTKESARTTIEFSAKVISDLVGVEFSVEDIKSYLSRVGVLVEGEETLTAHIPAERQDLNIKEDLADEVARLYGYANVPARALLAPVVAPVDHPDFILSNQIREFFARGGFTEVYGYSFTAKGVVEIEKPLASDKAYLRTNLTDWMSATLVSNIKHSLFPKDEVKLFEIGNVFVSEDEEQKRICVAANISLQSVINELKQEFNITELPEIKKIEGGEVVELLLSSLKAKDGAADLSPFIKSDVNYKPVSVYPRIVRDIALFVPAGTASSEVGEMIKQNAGPLLAEGPILFDEFTKPGEDRTSLAYRLAFQASDRTLEDAEVNTLMEKVYKVVKERGWEVR